MGRVPRIAVLVSFVVVVFVEFLFVISPLVLFMWGGDVWLPSLFVYMSDTAAGKASGPDIPEPGQIRAWSGPD